MKLTKFVHACLLVENGAHTMLFDPGVFSWESDTFAIDRLERLDTVVITHQHPDHFHPPFVEALVQKFPDATFVSTSPVVAELQKMGIKHASSETGTPLRIFSTRYHAQLEPLDSTPENIAIHYDDRLTVCGDRHDIEETKAILAFPITGPWGSARGALEMVLRLKPKYAVPLHDWHWNDRARQMEYDRFQRLLTEAGITFIRPVDGEPIEL